MNVPVTFVIATYNAENFLGACLSSIRSQSYSKADTEVLVVDGGSTDRTLEIARAYNVKILSNSKKIAEFGKAIGIQQATGKYIVILDADNELSDPPWLELQVAAMETNPSLIGMDPNFISRIYDPWINRYCAHLQLEDPFVRRLALLSKNATPSSAIGCGVYQITDGRFPIFGSNGFMWRADILRTLIANSDRFDEADCAAKAIAAGHRHIGHISGIGIYHRHVRTVREFIQKRFRRGN
jgi:glycosyltransferase involved in cell wall biosynthesis